ncbi:hypothetical protein RUND412_000261 [Rhizina undulata]
MASPNGPEDDVFERLKSHVDPKVVKEREEAVKERVRLEYERAQRRLTELIDENSTLPVRIASIKVEGSRRTRKGFLEKVLKDALSENKQSDYTLSSALIELQNTTNKLHRFGIFHPSISLYLDQKPRSILDPKAPTELTALISLKERSPYMFKTGTEIGSSEASGYAHALFRNVFGGAESLSATATIGNKTRNSYAVDFVSPINANPDITAELGGYASTRFNTHASHEEAVKGGKAGINWSDRYGLHELTYNGVWRQITGLGEKASLSVRNESGDSVKSSITHTITHDKRDDPLLPSRGYLLKSITELAGAGPLGGDVGFLKSQLEAQTAVPLGRGITFSVGLRGGLLYPIPIGFGDSLQPAKPSRINDRFFLGGPTDVRGFKECGLGPRDGEDAVGGDMFLAGGASLYFPLPNLGPEKPFRLQAFVNGGRVVGAQGTDTNEGVKNGLRDLVKELPSVAAGVGLVYLHEVARLELNFCLPVVKRDEEAARKGLQFGVGISFL